MSTLSLEAHAKINLSLDVLRKRPDGYHDVQMVMQTLSLSDTVLLTETASPGIRLETDSPALQDMENNLMYKAAASVFSEYPQKHGIHMCLCKRIPMAAGLAGGSSDAAAVILGMNTLFSLGLSDEIMCRIGKQLGADIPFCILQGTALSEGIGEILTPLPALPDCTILLAKPSIDVSTAFVYGHLDISSRPAEAHPDVSAVLQGLYHSDLNEICGSMGNILELVTCPAYPVINEIKSFMQQYGAISSMMSGSGPTVFGIFSDHDAALRCSFELKKGTHGADPSQVFITTPWNP